jgi:hypothetical protein
MVRFATRCLCCPKIVAAFGGAWRDAEMVSVEILAIGNELLIGDVLDTNTH